MKSLKKRQDIVKNILQRQLVAIIRLKQQSQVSVVIDCLVTGGITALEITANTPGFCQEITKAREKYPDILVGAGTIINEQRAIQAIKAGAQFLVTPNTEQAVVTIAHQYDIPVLLGALTPTDIAKAINFKADLIKVFPAGTLGINYFKDIQGPFSDVPLVPVGGINSENIQHWFNAGAIAVGVGNDLTNAAENLEQQQSLISLVKSYVSKLPNFKGPRNA